jgi:hypothetical protein
MSRLRILVALALASTVVTLSAAPAAAHNAGCVLTGNGEYVFVGSNNDSPTVSEQNPNSSYDPSRDANVLDLQPQTPGSDQYGTRYAADQGDSAVERPVACAATGPRADD